MMMCRRFIIIWRSNLYSLPMGQNNSLKRFEEIMNEQNLTLKRLSKNLDKLKELKKKHDINIRRDNNI